MARPLKEGVDYFPLDVDFFTDKKIKLIRAQFGVKGVYIVLAIMASIYQTGGYYKKWCDDDFLLMSEDVAGDCSTQLMSDVLTASFKRGIFDYSIFTQCGVITSAGIQRRYLRMVSKRTCIPIIREYWLLNEKDENDVPAYVLIKVVFKSISAEKTPVFGEKTIVSGTEKPINQSKVKNIIYDDLSSESNSDSDEMMIDERTQTIIDKIEHSIINRSLSVKEYDTVIQLISSYGVETVRQGVGTAIKAGGRSLRYVSKCVASASRTGRNDDERYAPTYQISEIEKLLDDEWERESAERNRKE